MREVRVTVRVPGCRVRKLVLVTTLLDGEKYPARDLAKLYAQRWRPPGGEVRQQVRDRVGRVRGEHPVDRGRVGVDADHRLALQVLRDVRDEAVRPDRHHEVRGLEQEPVEVSPGDPGVAPARRDRRRQGGDRFGLAVVDLAERRQILPLDRKSVV